MLWFAMWEDSIHDEDGRFVYVDGDGNRSAITEQEAEELKRKYLDYQAVQSFQRGGALSLEAERRKRGL